MAKPYNQFMTFYAHKKNNQLLIDEIATLKSRITELETQNELQKKICTTNSTPTVFKFDNNTQLKLSILNDNHIAPSITSLSDSLLDVHQQKIKNLEKYLTDVINNQFDNFIKNKKDTLEKAINGLTDIYCVMAADETIGDILDDTCNVLVDFKKELNDINELIKSLAICPKN